MEKLEGWQLILLALYAEAIHCGSFAEVTAAAMGMPGNEFGWTLYHLQMRGLIEGCRFQPPHPGTPGNLMGTLRDNLMLTPQGFQTAEALLADRRTTAERLHAVWATLRDVGVGVMANIVYAWLNA